MVECFAQKFKIYSRFIKHFVNLLVFILEWSFSFDQKNQFWQKINHALKISYRRFNGWFLRIWNIDKFRISQSHIDSIITLTLAYFVSSHNCTRYHLKRLIWKIDTWHLNSWQLPLSCNMFCLISTLKNWHLGFKELTHWQFLVPPFAWIISILSL